MNSFSGIPEPLASFLIYNESIQNKSARTTEEYFYDLRTFYRYLALHFGLVPETVEFNTIDINLVDLEILKQVDLKLIYEYLNYLNRVRENAASSRARKIASLRSFFKYVCKKANLLEVNPTAELDSVKINYHLPKFFTLDESLTLLNAVDGRNSKRDYCILTLFLNCGIRLAELVGINISDIKDDRLTVIGKGNKERTVYLNDACLMAIKNYLPEREKINISPGARNALFISQRGTRIGRRMVQTMVEKYVKKIGLDPRKYTTHKLRHTAATLMYESGADIRVLQEILGHKQLNTTEIYTHVSNENMRDAVKKNPLSYVRENRENREKESEK